MKVPTIEEFLIAGAQFGHKKERSDPRTRKFIFGIREGVNIIDLEKTQKMLKDALDYVSKLSSEGKIIIFVGTKRQAKTTIKSNAEKCGMPFVDQRWLGGMLTNYETVRRSIKRLELLEAEMASENFKKITKKEKLLLERKTNKLEESLQGIRTIAKTPDALFVVDAFKEHTAVSEAIKKGVPIVAICDTDANPALVNYPIPVNDDAAKSIELIVNLISQAVIEGKNRKTPAKVEKEVEKVAKNDQKSAEKKVEVAKKPKKMVKKITKKTK